MSHTVAIQTQFNRYEALEKALKSFGWTIQQKSKIRTYHSDPQRDKVYSYIGKNPQSGYDFGFDVVDGKVTQIHYDPYDGSIERQLGKQFCKLKVEYIKKVTEEVYDSVTVAEETEEYVMLEADDGE